MPNISSAWFEIPVTDMKRAAAFYSSVFDIQLEPTEFAGKLIAVFPYATSVGGGCLMHGDIHVPSSQGTFVYLTTGASLDGPLSRVAGSGGTAVIAKTPVGPGMGYYAQFLDSEGNRVGLFSME